MTTIVYSTAAKIDAMNAAAESIARSLRAAGVSVESVESAAQQFDACIEIGSPNVTVCVRANGAHLSIADEDGVSYGQTRHHDDIAGLIADILAAQ